MTKGRTWPPVPTNIHATAVSWLATAVCIDTTYFRSVFIIPRVFKFTTSLNLSWSSNDAHKTSSRYKPVETHRFHQISSSIVALSSLRLCDDLYWPGSLQSTKLWRFKALYPTLTNATSQHKNHVIAKHINSIVEAFIPGHFDGVYAVLHDTKAVVTDSCAITILLRPSQHRRYDLNIMVCPVGFKRPETFIRNVVRYRCIGIHCTASGAP